MHPANLRTHIRLMRVDDLPQVYAIDELSFSSPWSQRTFRYELQNNSNSRCWVAALDEKLVGFVICWLVVDEAHIATIAVHPAYRGQGLSKDLVITGLSDLIPLGALSATLEVRAGNFVAQNLYRYFGFEEVGLRKRYYRDTNEDALLMTVQPLGPDYLAWLNAGAENSWQGRSPAST